MKTKKQKDTLKKLYEELLRRGMITEEEEKIIDKLRDLKKED